MDAKVQIGLSDEFLEGTKVTTPAGEGLFREGVVVSDPTDPVARAVIVNAAPAADAYGLVVRMVGNLAIGTEVEVKNDVGNPLSVSGTVTANLGTLNGAATAANQTTGNTSLASIDGKLPDEAGTWGYAAGTSGTLTVGAGRRVLHISVVAPSLTAATMTINGGQTITIPAGASLTVSPKANLTNPTLVMTGTSSYFVEYVE